MKKHTFTRGTITKIVVTKKLVVTEVREGWRKWREDVFWEAKYQAAGSKKWHAWGKIQATGGMPDLNRMSS
jgi:hypothetical protein